MTQSVNVAPTASGQTEQQAQTEEQALYRAFRRALDGMREAVWFTGPDFRQIVYVAPAYESVWGRSCASLHDAPESWLEAVIGEDRGRVEQIAAAANEGRPYECEYRIVRGDGAMRQIRHRGFPVLDGEPEERRYVCVAEDITETRQRQDEFERFFNASPDLMAIIGFDGSIKRVNAPPELAPQLGGDELHSQPLLDFIHPDDRARAKLEIEQMISDGEPRSAELRTLQADGAYRYLWWTGRADRERRLIYVAARNIERQRLAQEMLALRVRQQSRVAELGARVLAIADLARLMADAASSVGEILNLDYVGVLELQNDKPEFLLRAGCGWEPETVGEARVSAEADTLAGHMLSTREPVIVSDLRSEGRFQESALLHEREIVSAVGCMIPNAERPYGVLIAFSKEPRTFNEDDVHFLQGVAHILAAAIERKEAEDELDRFFAPAMNPMFVGGFDGYVKRVNRATEVMTGFSAAELLAEPMLGFVHPDDQPLIAANIAKLAAGTATMAIEFRDRCRDGSYKWTHWSATPFPDKGVFYAVGYDVSDQHAARDALAERARQQKAVLEFGGGALVGGDLGPLFDEAVAALTHILRAEFATFLELSAESREFLLKAGCGWEPELIRKLRAPADPQLLYGYVLASKQPVVVEDVWTETRFHAHPLTTSHAIRSELACVVPGRPQPYGVLCVHSVQPRRFTQDDSQILQSVANILAAAIERRRAEEELSRFFEPSLNPMFVGGFDGMIKRCNAALELLTGNTREELTSRPIVSFVHPEDQAAVVNQIQKLAAGELTEAFECRVERTDGSYRWTFWNATSFPGCQTFYATGQDVTDRHAAEEALRASEETLRATGNSALDGIIRLDPDGKVAQWNAAAQTMFGYASEEILGRNLHETLIPAETREQYRRAWPQFRESGQGPFIGKVQELEALRKDGSRFPVEISIAAVSLHGRWNAVGIVRDVTQRKRAEAELLAAKQAAEAANRSKSEFLANMSHEIRTPMNGVIGLTSLVLDTPLSDEQRQYLDGVMLSADALLKIINDILDFSKIEAGRLELETIDFDLRETLENTIRTLALRAHEKGLELLCDVRPEAPDALVGDPARLWQVLVNLVGNAIKFTHEGEVVVTVAVESLGSDEVCLKFTVSDTGIGIAADKRNVLFKPFSQVDSSMTRKYGGTGLGLAISAQIVELMKGRIWFESELGQGSKFHFTACFGLRTTAAPKRAPLPPSGLDGLRVLVVDDNATNRLILRNMLTHWGMRPEEVEGGNAALQALRDAHQAGEPFGLILLDVMMPVMDGFTALQRIRQMPEISRPVIMMLSSRDEPGDSARSRELGAAAYIVKPIRPSELLDSIIDTMGISLEAAGEPPGATATAGVAPRGPSLRILVAEDNPINQMLAVRLLEKAGHSVHVANNGEEVLIAVGREAFDLVLMDVQMPVMDGFEATALIRQQEKATRRHLPIVAMTAHAMKGDRERCLEAGMDGYVAKPIQKQDLFNAMEAAVPGKTPAPI